MSIYSLKVNVSYKLFSIKCWKEFETAFQSGIDRIKKKQNVLEALITGHLCKAQHFVKKKKRPLWICRNKTKREQKREKVEVELLISTSMAVTCYRLLFEKVYLLYGAREWLQESVKSKVEAHSLWRTDCGRDQRSSKVVLWQVKARTSITGHGGCRPRGPPELKHKGKVEGKLW